jgi:hypothetical protein
VQEDDLKLGKKIWTVGEPVYEKRDLAYQIDGKVVQVKYPHYKELL